MATSTQKDPHLQYGIVFQKEKVYSKFIQFKRFFSVVLDMNVNVIYNQQIFKYSKATIETLEEGVKYVPS